MPYGIYDPPYDQEHLYPHVYSAFRHGGIFIIHCKYCGKQPKTQIERVTVSREENNKGEWDEVQDNERYPCRYHPDHPANRPFTCTKEITYHDVNPTCKYEDRKHPHTRFERRYRKSDSQGSGTYELRICIYCGCGVHVRIGDYELYDKIANNEI